MADDYNSNLAQEIQKEEQLDISIERVDKIPSPLLVIGLGGTGSGIVHKIKKTFAQRFVLPKDEKGNLIPIPPQTAYLEIDTSRKSKGSLTDDEFVDISVEGIDSILDPVKRDFNLPDYERKWVNKQLNASSSGAGAGTYRQAARLQMSRNYAKVESAIKNALTKIVRVTQGAGGVNGRVEIVIVTGICGGTGSGTFLDVPQIARKCMEEGTLAGQPYQITGYIVMPDVSLSVPAIAGNPNLTFQLSMNGFAALKELDFWQNIASHHTVFTANLNGVEVPWKRAPYDACILMSGKTVDGKLFENGTNVVESTIAENLLHYLANENPTAQSNGQSTYTYIEHENNLKAAVEAMTATMPKKLPVLYGYRAIGAYTKKIPKKKVLYYEGSVLFKTFMPLRDDHDKLVPNTDLLQDGKNVQRAAEIVGNPGQLFNNFRTAIKLPAFCGVASTDRPHLDAMRNMPIQPHEQVDVKPTLWESTVVRPAANKTASQYLEGAWNKFCQFARLVITNPKYGPFSLLEYLTNPSGGLLKELEAQLVNWNALVGKFRGDLTNRKDACKGFWSSFSHPPIMGARPAIEKYLGALNEYFLSVAKADFMETHARSLTLLVQRVKEYVNTSLKPLCEDIEQLSLDFEKVEAEDTMLASDLFSLDTVRGQIDADFVSKNDENKITLEFLGAVFDESVKSTPSVDSHSTGLSFTYGIRRSVNLLDALKQELDQCFGEINTQSLDAIMEQAVGSDVAEQTKYMDGIGNSIIGSSKPMFSQDGGRADEMCTKYNYLSIPENSKKFIKHFSGKGQDIECKESSLTDHMYCITSWDGLPMYRYGLIKNLEDAYSKSLDHPAVSMGAHLIYDGDLDSNYLTNWTKLPSPWPYYFFSMHGTPFAEKQYADIHALTERAIDAGMVEVDTSNPMPVYHVKAFYSDSRREVVLPAKNVAEKAQEIMNLSRNDETGRAYGLTDKLKMLKDLMASAARETIQPGQKPDCMATYMGLQNEPVDPYNPQIAVDANMLKTAQKNYAALCREMASAVISYQPRLALILQQQVEGFEAIQHSIDEIERLSKIWEPRIAYAETYGTMYIHGLVTLAPKGGYYRDETNRKTDLIPGKTEADIADLDPLLKSACYLADIGTQHEVRTYLEFHMRQAEDDFDEKSRADELTKEYVQGLLDQVADLKAEAENSEKEQNVELRKQGADTEAIRKRLALIKNLKDLCDARERMYKRAMPK